MDIRAQLADLHAQSEAVLANADAAEPRRDLTEAEKVELDRLDAEYSRLKVGLDVHERGQEVAAMRGIGRRSVPDQMDGTAGGWAGGSSSGHRAWRPDVCQAVRRHAARRWRVQVRPRVLHGGILRPVRSAAAGSWRRHE